MKSGQGVPSASHRLSQLFMTLFFAYGTYVQTKYVSKGSFFALP
jgi:hypothetical protein